MEYLLFITYLVLFTWLITKIKFFTDAGLSRSQLIIVFLLKVMAGIFYGWMGIYYSGLAQMADTWMYHQNGIVEYHLLGDDPHAYFTNLFNNPAKGFDNLFTSSDSFWNDLKSNIFIKFLSILDIFSFGYYYVNVIFYSFITLFGPIAIYRVMNDVFPGRKIPLLIATFLIPSFLYWASGLHKEGLIFTALALIIHAIYFANKVGKITVLRWIVVLAGMLILFALRNFVFAAFIPACIAWLLANKWRRHNLKIFLAVYTFFILLFFCGRYINPHLDFPQSVVNKQQSFLSLEGGRSNVPINELEPVFLSFLKNTPQAITLSALRPYPGDVRHLPSLAAAVEINLLLLLLILFLFFRVKNKGPLDSSVYCCFFFSISLMLAIGYTSNNLGAIVRYKSILLPLLIIPLAVQVDWNRLLGIFSGDMKRKQPL